MEISFCGRGNDNLLTSHATDYLTHPPTRSGYSVADLTLPPSSHLCDRATPRTAADRVSAALSFIVPTIYDSVYTGRLAGRRYRTVPEVSSDSSTRDSSYIPAGDSAPHRFYRSCISCIPRTFTPNLPICV